MRGKLTAARLTTVLATLLGLAYLLVLSGRLAEDTTPSATNTSPAGLSAFAELLRRSGYRVRREDDLRPRFGANELVVVPLPAPTGFVPNDGDGPNAEDPDGPLAKRLPIAPGGVIVLAGTLGQATDRTYVNRVTGERVRVRAGETGGFVSTLASLAPTVAIYREDGESGGISEARLSGRRVLFVERGEIAANRNLDQARNADLLLGLVRAAAPGQEIVIYEALLRPGGLLAALGDWAFAARNQLLLAAGLLALSLGSRFGLAPKTRRRESGQREQADALGNLLRRWRGPRAGIEAAIEQSRRRLAKGRRLPASAPREQWDKYLSPALISVIEDAEEWTRQKAREREALGAIARLNAATDAELSGTGGGVYRES